MFTVDLTESAVVALSRSALYGVLASAFRHPYNPLFRKFALPEEALALHEALSLAGDENIDTLLDAASALTEIAPPTTDPALAEAFVRLFGHTSRGAAPPYETEYGTGGPFSQSQEMSDISGFYRAFGLEVDSARHERFDHVCCECEFMCFLCARQAQALQDGEHTDAEAVARAQRLFLRDHLARFGHTFFFRIRQEAAGPWHDAAARLGMAFLEAECLRLKIPVDREYLPLRATEDVAVPMACGDCTGTCAGAAIPEE